MASRQSSVNVQGTRGCVALRRARVATLSGERDPSTLLSEETCPSCYVCNHFSLYVQQLWMAHGSRGSSALVPAGVCLLPNLVCTLVCIITVSIQHQ